MSDQKQSVSSTSAKRTEIKIIQTFAKFSNSASIQFNQNNGQSVSKLITKKSKFISFILPFSTINIILAQAEVFETTTTTSESVLNHITRRRRMYKNVEKIVNSENENSIAIQHSDEFINPANLRQEDEHRTEAEKIGTETYDEIDEKNSPKSENTQSSTSSTLAIHQEKEEKIEKIHQISSSTSGKKKLKTSK